MKIPGHCAATLGFVLGVAACSSGQEASVDATPSTSTTVADVETSTTVVEAAALPSVGSVTIGDTQYDFSFECFLDDDGEVLALGVGQEPATDQGTEAVVQVFDGQPYVAVLINDERLLELAIDSPAELFVQSGVISGSALRFVESGESAGVGESVGLGAVSIECSSFAPGLPEGFNVS